MKIASFAIFAVLIIALVPLLLAATTSVQGDGNRPSITVTPTSGFAYSEVIIVGEYFPPNRVLDELTIFGEPLSPELPITDENGEFIFTGLIPCIWSGGYAIKATIDDMEATSSFTISTSADGSPRIRGAFSTIEGIYNMVYFHKFNEQKQQWHRLVPTYEEDDSVEYDPCDSRPNYPSMVNGNGYWIYVIQDCVLTSGGDTYNLFEGWNLIGWLGCCKYG